MKLQVFSIFFLLLALAHGTLGKTRARNMMLEDPYEDFDLASSNQKGGSKSSGDAFCDCCKVTRIGAEIVNTALTACGNVSGPGVCKAIFCAAYISIELLLEQGASVACFEESERPRLNGWEALCSNFQ